MLKKFIKKLVTVAAVFVLGITVLYISTSRIIDNINESRRFNAIPKNVKRIHDKAAEYKHKKGYWPPSVDSISPRPLYFDTLSFTFTSEVREDTFVVKALIQNTHGIPEELIGGCVTVDNFGNKTYSHEALESNYLKAYLYEAKKVESK